MIKFPQASALSFDLKIGVTKQSNRLLKCKSLILNLITSVDLYRDSALDLCPVLVWMLLGAFKVVDS